MRCNVSRYGCECRRRISIEFDSNVRRPTVVDAVRRRSSDVDASYIIAAADVLGAIVRTLSMRRTADVGRGKTHMGAVSSVRRLGTSVVLQCICTHCLSLTNFNYDNKSARRGDVIVSDAE
jgi:hypothetical protein